MAMTARDDNVVLLHRLSFGFEYPQYEMQAASRAKYRKLLVDNLPSVAQLAEAAEVRKMWWSAVSATPLLNRICGGDEKVGF